MTMTYEKASSNATTGGLQGLRTLRGENQSVSLGTSAAFRKWRITALTLIFNFNFNERPDAEMKEHRVPDIIPGIKRRLGEMKDGSAQAGQQREQQGPRQQQGLLLLLLLLILNF